MPSVKDTGLRETARELLSFAREAGTPAAARSRELVKAHLTRLGYTVTVQKFTFTPASLRAFPLFGAGLGGLALILFPFLGTSWGPSWGALALWLAGLLGLGIIAAGVGLGWVPLGDAVREDANLIATRRDQRPQRWIVAHLDSKAQAQSMAGRLLAVWAIALAAALLAALAVLRLWGPLHPVWAALGTIVALLAGVLAGRGRLRGSSLGARDNGSGVVAALKAAESSSDPRIGILITGAEEFGLVGARVFARTSAHLPADEFVNLDTLDQEGALYLVSHDGSGSRLAQRLEYSLSRLNIPIKRRRLPLGIFVDSAALSRTGGSALTIGRLTWKTLRCIHTPADTPEGFSLDFAESVGEAVAQIDL